MTMWAILPDDLTRIRAALEAGPRADTPAAPEALFGSVSLESGEQERPYRITADGTAIVQVTGALYADSAPWWLVWITDGTTYGRIVHAVSRAVDDGQVQRIVLDIDSPGGQVTGVAEAAQALAELATKKPLVAYARGYCASAAYWLASQCTEVTASPTAGVGSIGVVVHLYDHDRRLQQAGIDHVVVTNADSPKKAPNVTQESGRADIQRMVDQVASAFFDAVAVGRSVDGVWARDSMGKGAVLVGQDAIDARLIDRIVIGPESACDEPEDEAEAAIVVDDEESPHAGVGHTSVEGNMPKGTQTPAASGGTAADHRDARIAELEATLAANEAVRADLTARLQAAEADLSARIETEQQARLEAVLAKHIERGALLPVAREQWTATAKTIGVEQVDALLSGIPDATTRPTKLVGSDAAVPASMTRAELHGHITARAKEWAVDYPTAHARLQREQPHLFRGSEQGEGK